MNKSILIIDTEDFKDIMETLKTNELYLEAKSLEDCTQDTTELLKALEELKRFTSNGVQVNTAFNKLHKALGGKDD